MKKIVVLLFMILMLMGGESYGDSVKKGELIKPLRFFSSIIGKTWTGKFQDPGSGKVMQDVSRWERALNGTAIKIVHSLNRGEYGGETTIIWNPEKSRIEFYYFTTGGFMTKGWMEIENRKFTSYERVTGNAGGITEVKAVVQMLDDGNFEMSSSYLKKGKWVKGMKVIYKEAPGEKIIFR